MSNDVVIRAEALGKKYLIGHQSKERTSTFRDAIVRSVNALGRTSADILRGKPLVSGDEIEEFWALKDVSFDIKRGDVVGIVGRNGAGKSTLLKVLSRITEPSEGRVEIKGRVASLLEVGTGFHPELTGRENIYLNGAILGMTRAEIHRKFDEIVDFSGVEKFLDTPVKRYSSGMYVRLAFAVAAHLEPEILIVDEVLAVGDAEFQKKCLGKMQDVAGHGRTVLFVSHNVNAIRRLCVRSVILKSGKLVFDSNVEDCLSLYNQVDIAELGTADLTVAPRRSPPDSRIRLTQLRQIGSVIAQDGEVQFAVSIQVSAPLANVVFGIGFSDLDGNRILSSDSDYSGQQPYSFMKAGEYDLQFRIHSLNLCAGDYLLDVGCRTTGLVMLDNVAGARTIRVAESNTSTPVHGGGFRTALVRSDWVLKEK